MSESIERYASKEWADGEVITATKMNNISGSLHEIDSEIINARTKGKSANDTIGKRIDDLIIVSDAQPILENNEIWIKETSAEVQIPTYTELQDLIICQDEQPIKEINRIWIRESSENEIEIPEMHEFDNLKEDVNYIKNKMGVVFSEKPLSEFTHNSNNGYINGTNGNFVSNSAYKCYYFTANESGTMYITDTNIAMILAICTEKSFDEQGNIKGIVRDRRTISDGNLPTIENPISFKKGETIVFSFQKNYSPSVYISNLYVNTEKIKEMSNDITHIKNDLEGFVEKPLGDFIKLEDGYIDNTGKFQSTGQYSLYVFTASESGKMYVTSSSYAVLVKCKNANYSDSGWDDTKPTNIEKKSTSNNDMPTEDEPILFEPGDTIALSIYKNSNVTVYVTGLLASAKRIKEISNNLSDIDILVKGQIIAQESNLKETATSYPVNIIAGRKYRLIVTGVTDPNSEQTLTSIRFWINKEVAGANKDALINFDTTFGEGEKYVDFIGVENANYIRKGSHQHGTFSFVLIDISGSLVDVKSNLADTNQTVENTQETMLRTPLVKFNFNDYTIKYDKISLYEDVDTANINNEQRVANNNNDSNKFTLELTSDNYIRFDHNYFMEELYEHYDTLVNNHTDYMDRIIVVGNKEPVEGENGKIVSGNTNYLRKEPYDFELTPPDGDKTYYVPDGTNNEYEFDIRLYHLLQIHNTLANIEDDKSEDYKESDAINKNKYTVRPKLLLIGGTHATEMESQYTLFQFVKNLCECTVNDTDLFKLRNSFDIYVLPILDGYSQKYADSDPDNNPYLGRTNYNGVNLNRNFYYKGWKPNNPMVEDADHNLVYNANYTGEEYGSEFETQVVMKIIDVLQPDGVIDVHGHGQTSHVMYTILNKGENGRARALYSSAVDITIAFKRAYPEYYGTSSALVDCGPAPKSTAINYGTVSAYATTIGIPLAACIEVPGVIAWNNGEYAGTWHHRCDCIVYGLDEYMLRNQILHYCQWILDHVEKEET